MPGLHRALILTHQPAIELTLSELSLATVAAGFTLLTADFTSATWLGHSLTPFPYLTGASVNV
jgi:hypothetical protein